MYSLFKFFSWNKRNLIILSISPTFIFNAMKENYKFIEIISETDNVYYPWTSNSFRPEKFLAIALFSTVFSSINVTVGHAEKYPSSFITELSRAAIPGTNGPSIEAAELLKNEEIDVTVTGTVVDQNGESLPGVTVSVQGTTVGTSTDINGNYSITVPEGATLVFSF